MFIRSHRAEWMFALAIAALLSACASEPPRRKRTAPAPVAITPDFSYVPGSRPLPGDEARPRSRPDEMTLAHEKGVLDQRDVESALDRHARPLGACYERAGAAQKYAEGEVTLRFVVSASGAVDDVLVVGNGLGNYAVERCLMDEGRKIAFPAPRGGQPTEFEYPLMFRSSGVGAVETWSGDVAARKVAAQLPALAACGELGPEPVRAVAYVRPGGAIGSVGLVSSGPLDPQAAACVVEQIGSWRLPDDRNAVVRTTFSVAPLPPAPSKRLVRRAR